MFHSQMKGSGVPTTTPAQTSEHSIEKQSSPPTSKWQRLSFRRKLIFIAVPIVMLVALALGLGLGLGLHQASASPTHHHKAPKAASTSASASASATPLSSAKAADYVTPTLGMTWDYPLGYDVTASNVNASVKFYSVDLEYTDDSVIKALKNAGHYVACYFSAGSVEKGRDDAGDFPDAAIGNVMDGWPDEKWVDTRNSKVRDIMTARITTARNKGCNGVDPDNIDGYLDGNVDTTKFSLTKADSEAYVKFLANEAHSQQLACGLKNGGEMAADLVSVTDWEINEQCTQYESSPGVEECVELKVFIDNKKPVFHVEYTTEDDDTNPSAAFVKKACAAGGQSGFSSIIKHEPLDEWVKFC